MAAQKVEGEVIWRVSPQEASTARRLVTPRPRLVYHGECHVVERASPRRFCPLSAHGFVLMPDVTREMAMARRRQQMR